jgi:hypothetical protein
LALGFQATHLKTTWFSLVIKPPPSKNNKFIAQAMNNYCEARARVTGLSPAQIPDAQSSGYWTASQAVASEQIKCRASHKRHPALDCDVTINLYREPRIGTLLGKVAEEHVGVRHHLEAVPGTINFSYWNNADPDDQVCPADWDRRAALWHGALDAGFSFKMAGEPTCLTLQRVAQALPSLAERINVRADNFMMNQYIEEVTGQEQADYSSVVRMMREAREALHTPGNPWIARLLSYQFRLSEILLPDLGPLLATKLVDLPVARAECTPLSLTPLATSKPRLPEKQH